MVTFMTLNKNDTKDPTKWVSTRKQLYTLQHENHNLTLLFLLFQKSFTRKTPSEEIPDETAEQVQQRIAGLIAELIRHEGGYHTKDNTGKDYLVTDILDANAKLPLDLQITMKQLYFLKKRETTDEEIHNLVPYLIRIVAEQSEASTSAPFQKHAFQRLQQAIQDILSNYGENAQFVVGPASNSRLVIMAMNDNAFKEVHTATRRPLKRFGLEILPLQTGRSRAKTHRARGLEAHKKNLTFQKDKSEKQSWERTAAAVKDGRPLLITTCTDITSPHYGQVVAAHSLTELEANEHTRDRVQSFNKRKREDRPRDRERRRESELDEEYSRSSSRARHQWSCLRALTHTNVMINEITQHHTMHHLHAESYRQLAEQQSQEERITTDFAPRQMTEREDRRNRKMYEQDDDEVETTTRVTTKIRAHASFYLLRRTYRSTQKRAVAGKWSTLLLENSPQHHSECTIRQKHQTISNSKQHGHVHVSTCKFTCSMHNIYVTYIVQKGVIAKNIITTRDIKTLHTVGRISTPLKTISPDPLRPASSSALGKASRANTLGDGPIAHTMLITERDIESTLIFTAANYILGRLKPEEVIYLIKNYEMYMKETTKYRYHNAAERGMRLQRPTYRILLHTPALVARARAQERGRDETIDPIFLHTLEELLLKQQGYILILDGRNSPQQLLEQLSRLLHMMEDKNRCDHRLHQLQQQ